MEVQSNTNVGEKRICTKKCARTFKMGAGLVVFCIDRKYAQRRFFLWFKLPWKIHYKYSILYLIYFGVNF